jgi:hypothetical protein
MYWAQSGTKRDSASADLSVRMHPSLAIVEQAITIVNSYVAIA